MAGSQNSLNAVPGNIIVWELRVPCRTVLPLAIYLLITYKYTSGTGSTLTRPEAEQAPYKRSASRHLGSMVIIAPSSPLHHDVWIRQCPGLRTRQPDDTLTPTVSLTEECVKRVYRCYVPRWGNFRRTRCLTALYCRRMAVVASGLASLG